MPKTAKGPPDCTAEIRRFLQGDRRNFDVVVLASGTLVDLREGRLAVSAGGREENLRPGELLIARSAAAPVIQPSRGLAWENWRAGEGDESRLWTILGIVGQEPRLPVTPGTRPTTGGSVPPVFPDIGTASPGLGGTGQATESRPGIFEGQ